MTSPITLTIAGYSNLQKGIREASVQNGVIELVFKKKAETITTASLSAERISFYKTAKATQEKISLICKRYGFDEQQLNYDNIRLSKTQELTYKILHLKKILLKALIPQQWIIVYKKENDKRWNKIIPNSKVFQADTFVVFKDEKYYIFYEELAFNDYHGYLKVAELDIETNQLINDEIILNLDYHLSYPNVFEDNGTYYMIPESRWGGSIDLYECKSFPYKWVKKKTLINDISAVDTTPLKTKDAWYLFTTIIEKGADYHNELSIFKSSDLFNKPFEKLYEMPVVTDVTNARMGGQFFEKEGDIYRVSQDCGKRYGHQAKINKVLQIEGGYKEEHIETLEADFGALGFHTYNQDHDLIVGDMEIPRFDWYSLKRVIWGNVKLIIFGR